MIRRAAAVAGLGVLAAGLAACTVNVNTEGATAQETHTFTVGASPTISLETFDGAIEVHSWDRPDVEVVVEKQAQDDGLLQQIVVEKSQEGNQVTLSYTVTNRGPGITDKGAQLLLRGLRTLGTRLRQHEMNGLQLARWLVQQPQVARVVHPGRPDHPQHDLWLRDFSGACGLFGFELHPCTRTQLAAFLDGLKLFGMGYSWGGFESLIIPAHAPRTVRKWKTAGPWLRVHVGLEEIEDLINDLALGFQRLSAAAPPPGPAAPAAAETAVAATGSEPAAPGSDGPPDSDSEELPPAEMTEPAGEQPAAGDPPLPPAVA